MLFTFPSRYLFTIGRRGVLRLGGWSPHVQTGFHVSRPTRVSCCLMATGLSPTMADFSKSFAFISQEHWPGPGSLATTTGVSVDVLSSGYLDVSVPRVRSMKPMYSAHCTFNNRPTITPKGRSWKTIKSGFPHSEITGSKGASASPVLIAACHVFHRLSTPRHPSEALQRLIVSQQNPCTAYPRPGKR